MVLHLFVSLAGWVGIWLRNVGRGLTPVCELAAFGLANLGVFVGFDSEVGGRGRTLVWRAWAFDGGHEILPIGGR